MEQPSNELVEKSLYLLNKLYNNNIINQDKYELLLFTFDRKNYNFVVLRNFKELIRIFCSDASISYKEIRYYIDFFNTEKEKHRQEYIKIFHNDERFNL